MTSTSASVIDEQGFSVRRTIRIAASVDKVWRAVTDPEHISRWFGQVVLDGAAVGARGGMTVEGYGVIPMRIEAIEPQRLVAYRWGADDAAGTPPAEVDESSTVFTFTLEDLGDDGTQLTVVETGFERTSDPAANLESHRQGWDSELDKLVALLEGAG
ncbi:SRPBCC domain-containing protein [Agromyces sp. LHK192]|uniref:SRPBCC domain-containing protein n=1 Tax=Agromyces sp. LHK192 TaxID=2498704 RepID=UPI001F0C58E5|nr:SRPBCC domain-containing protein [Agromyces sp. LHK192]